MAAAVVLRSDIDGAGLRGLARASKDAKQVRRLLALAAIYEGSTRSEAARIGGVTLQIARDWVVRFNARSRPISMAPSARPKARPPASCCHAATPKAGRCISRKIAATVAPGAHAGLLLDQAGWHGSGALIVPPNITLMPLPSKCPELNPVENIWQFMRDNWLSNRIFKSYDDILDQCCFA